MTAVLTREADLTREATLEVMAPWMPAPPTAQVEAARLRRRHLAAPPADIVEQWGMESFPASDPPANW